jgi:hypothetical protein
MSGKLVMWSSSRGSLEKNMQLFKKESPATQSVMTASNHGEIIIGGVMHLNERQ